MYHKNIMQINTVKVCEHNPAIFSLAQFPKQPQNSAPPWTMHLVIYHIIYHILWLNVEN